MNTPPVKDLEQHLRTHYHEEFGDPSSASTLWSAIEGRLPAQEHPQSWWQRWLQSLSPSGVALTPAPRHISTRKIILTGSLAFTILLLTAGAFYTASTFSLHQNPQTQVTRNTDVASTALLSSLVKSDAVTSTLDLTSTNQTQSTSSGTVHLQQTYADTNNIAIGFTHTTTQNLKVTPTQSLKIIGNASTITLPNHQSLKPTREIIKVDGNTQAVVDYFDGSSIQGNPRTLQLSISISIGSTTAHFNATVPFTAGKIINVNQSATNQGHVVQIDRVVMTPSETRFYYSTRDKDLDILFANNLTIGGQDTAKLPLTTDLKRGINVWNGGIPHGYFIWLINLQHKTGPWALNVGAMGHPDFHWQFTFNVQ